MIENEGTNRVAILVAPTDAQRILRALRDTANNLRNARVQNVRSQAVNYDQLANEIRQGMISEQIQKLDAMAERLDKLAAS